MTLDSARCDWLLDTDPALRWQVERDLLAEPDDVWQATRARVATEGLGARLLALQDDDGQWAGGAYFPQGHRWGVDEQPWTATTWSLKSLREWGVAAAALTGTVEKLAACCRWEHEDLPYWDGEVDVCINAFTLGTGAWLGADVSALRDWFAEHQLADGGWNCEWEDGSTRSSFHSTLNALTGLLAHESYGGGSEALRSARHRGEEYLLERRLLYRLSTGELVGPWVTTLEYPDRWGYGLLRALDHFRRASLHDHTAPDPRLEAAIDVIRSKRTADGRWLQERRDPGAVWFHEDVPEGEPSPWLTLLAVRVLDWWDAAHPPR